MSTPSQPLPALSNITIIQPGPNQCLRVNSDGTVLVAVNNPDLNACAGRIHDYNAGTGTLGRDYGSVDLVRQGSTNRFSANVPAGPVAHPSATSNNKYVKVLDKVTGDEVGNPFLAVAYGSGSCPGTLGVEIAALRDRFAQKDAPIPVAVVLKLDSPVQDGTSIVSAQLNAPIQLAHSQDAQHFSAWVSAPIVFCNISGETGHWILDKTAPRVWTLQLKRAKAAVATYVLHNQDDRDATFPLALSLQGEGGCECTGWPRSVTITLAP